MKKVLLLIMLFTSLGSLAGEMLFTPINTSDGLSDNQIRYISQLKDGRMVFTTSGSINIYDGFDFKYIHRRPENIFPLDGYHGFYRIYPQSDSLLWIKDHRKLMCIDLYAEKYIDPQTNPALSSFGIEAINDLFVDEKNNLWTLHKDTILYKNGSAVFDISSNNGILQDLFADEDCLYLFYNNGAIVCYDLQTGEQLYSKTAYGSEDVNKFRNTSLVVAGSKGFYQLRNGYMGGFFFFDKKKRSWQTILETGYSLNTLIVGDDRYISISCFKGLWEIDLDEGTKKYYPELKTVEGGNVSTEISTLFMDVQGAIWIGTLNRGLLYYHPSRYKFTTYSKTDFPGYPEKDLTVNRFAESSNGEIYLNCNGTFYRYSDEKDKRGTLTLKDFGDLPANIKEQLGNGQNFYQYRDKHYSTLIVDSHKRVWGGTPDGLDLYEDEKDVPITFYRENGLSNNFIQGLLEDRNGNIWVTTSHGITKVVTDENRSQIKLITYNSFEGTLRNEYSNNAIFESADGRLFFGGIDGFNILNPENEKSDPLPYKPVLTGVRLFGENTEIGKAYDGNVILKKSAPFTDEFTFNHDQNFLTFEFSPLNYRNRSQTFYRYKLEGADENWYETSATEKKGNFASEGAVKITYTNLSHGKYALKIYSRDNSTDWMNEPTVINFTIKTPWWKTPLAYILYFVVGSMIFGAIVFLYNFYSKKRLELKHKEEILLLRVKNLIEQCGNYEKEYKQLRDNLSTGIKTVFDGENDEDCDFVTKAVEFVENNLNNPDYSVEKLSIDLCMERTGLYRKLITILDQSPSLFIRNIRLKRAAQLILENNMTMGEISENVGFSSPSYMSKCFQETYGCKPSEYIIKVKEKLNEE